MPTQRVELSRFSRYSFSDVKNLGLRTRYLTEFSGSIFARAIRSYEEMHEPFNTTLDSLPRITEDKIILSNGVVIDGCHSKGLSIYSTKKKDEEILPGVRILHSPTPMNRFVTFWAFLPPPFPKVRHIYRENENANRVLQGTLRIHQTVYENQDMEFMIDTTCANGLDYKLYVKQRGHIEGHERNLKCNLGHDVYKPTQASFTSTGFCVGVGLDEIRFSKLVSLMYFSDH